MGTSVICSISIPKALSIHSFIRSFVHYFLGSTCKGKDSRIFSLGLGTVARVPATIGGA